ncbi:MAG: LysM peptidoglycan-binding domain-containing protein [Planctomycetes bacterium]|nr:LysM peptidoglycan-binding domain-containing protein [Planctomycetota bacterium]
MLFTAACTRDSAARRDDGLLSTPLSGYLVRDGDTRVSISRRFGVTESDYQECMHLLDTEDVRPGHFIWVPDRSDKGDAIIGDRDDIVPGSHIKVPTRLYWYSLKPGDTIVTMAQRSGLDPAWIRQANAIPAGQEVKAPRVIVLGYVGVAR